MKTKYKNIIIIICSLFFLVNLIIYRNLVFDTVGFSLNIWITSLLPALFPFFIVSDILINYDVIKYFPKVIRNSIKYLFNVSDNVGISPYYYFDIPTNNFLNHPLLLL